MTVTIPKGCNAGKGVKVSLDPIRIKVNKSAKITWKMGTPGWTFAANGIDFPKWTGDAETAFKGKPTFDTDSQGKPTKDFAVTNESKKPGTHKYDVNLIAPDKSTCKHDPTVVNW